jgi:hypothetical protein
MVARRMRQVPGAIEAIDDAAMDALILHSGGVLRWLVTLVRDACIEAHLAGADRLTESSALTAIERNAQGFQVGQDSIRIEELRRVRLEKFPSGSEVGRLLVQEQFVLAYMNGDVWFDVHPLLWPGLGARGIPPR